MSVTPTLLDNREPDRQPTMQLEDSSLSAVLHVLGAVESSADPKTVFLSVARAAVPVVCDSVTVVLEADREQRLHFSHPAGATEPAPVQRERLADKAAHLERALASNREIGSAMGILMINHKITGDQARPAPPHQPARAPQAQRRRVRGGPDGHARITRGRLSVGHRAGPHAIASSADCRLRGSSVARAGARPAVPT